MKIAEIKEKLIKGNATDEMVEEFKTALKRVPRNQRSQHCYTTAVAMKVRNSGQAIALIEYGLQLCDGWLDTMRSHHNLAIIYEKCGQLEQALENYKTAMWAAPAEQTGYVYEYSSHLMRMQMHISGFEYTDALKGYYEEATKADEFSRSFMNKALYEAVAEIIIFKHEGNLTEMKNSYDKATEMLSPSYVGFLTSILKKKKYAETSGASKETLAFLKKVKKLLLKK